MQSACGYPDQYCHPDFLMSSDFEVAAAIVQHQMTQALPTVSMIVKFVAATLQIRTTHPTSDGKIIRYILTALQDCRDAIYRLPIETIAIYGMQGTRNILWKKSFSLEEVFNDTATRNNRDLFSFSNKYMNRAAFPSAFLFSAIAHWTGLDSLFLGLRIWTHEFGHATVAWFSGHQATPLPFGWTNVGEDRSIVVYVCFSALWGLLFYTGLNEKKRGIMACSVVAAIVQFWMTWFTSQDMFELRLAFGGVGGEFYLSTVLMLAFYVPLPEKWRWDCWRYLILLIAASTFFNSVSFWNQIKRGTAAIPWGTMLNGSGDAGGDMNQLSDLGWSDMRIVQTYVGLGQVCLLILIGFYGFQFLRTTNFRRS